MESLYLSLIDWMIARRELVKVSKAVEIDFILCTRLALDIIDSGMLFLICNAST